MVFNDKGQKLLHLVDTCFFSVFVQQQFHLVSLVSPTLVSLVTGITHSGFTCGFTGFTSGRPSAST